MSYLLNKPSWRHTLVSLILHKSEWITIAFYVQANGSISPYKLSAQLRTVMSDLFLPIGVHNVKWITDDDVQWEMHSERR